MPHRFGRVLRGALTASGLIGLTASSGIAMVVEAIGDQIVMSGPVEYGDNVKLERLLNENPQITTVILRDSLGGKLDPGQFVSNMIRTRGLRTAVSGYCASACALMYLGGVERAITNEKPAGLTYIGLHGASDSQTHTVLPWKAAELQDWINAYTGNKFDKELLRKITKNARGLTYIYDSERLRRADKVSVFVCQGDEKKKPVDCEKIAGMTGYDQGVFTSKELVRVNKPDPNAPKAKSESVQSRLNDQ